MWEAREKKITAKIIAGKVRSSRKGKNLNIKNQKICFGCGKPGHIKANCRNTWSREGSRRKKASGGAYDPSIVPMARRQKPRQHTSEAEGDNSAAKGTNATTPTMKTRAHLMLRK